MASRGSSERTEWWRWLTVGKFCHRCYCVHWGRQQRREAVHLKRTGLLLCAALEFCNLLQVCLYLSHSAGGLCGPAQASV